MTLMMIMWAAAWLIHSSSLKCHLHITNFTHQQMLVPFRTSLEVAVARCRLYLHRITSLVISWAYTWQLRTTQWPWWCSWGTSSQTSFSAPAADLMISVSSALSEWSLTEGSGTHQQLLWPICNIWQCTPLQHHSVHFITHQSFAFY